MFLSLYLGTLWRQTSVWVGADTMGLWPLTLQAGEGAEMAEIPQHPLYRCAWVESLLALSEEQYLSCVIG